MVLGGVFSATLIFVGMAVSPLTAQRDTFGEITCTGLRVLYPDGTVAVYLGQSDDGGEVNLLRPRDWKDAGGDAEAVNMVLA